MAPQRTVRSATRIEGIGLHTGSAVRVELRPAPPHSGVDFVRTDLPGTPRVAASVANLVSRPRRTAIASGPCEVHTVEHLLAVLHVLGIHNLEVRLDGPELPGLDGSALGYLEAIRRAGIADQDAAVREIRVGAPVAVRDDRSSLVAMPNGDGLSVSYTLSYEASCVGTQHVSFDITEDTFAEEIAPARTFVLEEEARQLQAAGLGKGASTENTLVVGANGVIGNELRFADEFVRHKILDLLGDIFLTQCAVRASLVATKSGHTLNWELARSLVSHTAGDAPVPVARTDASHDSGKESPEGDPRDLSNTTEPIDIRVIEQMLPHRYPFLLVDRVLEITDGQRGRGLKNVSFNEEFFQGHFPGRPVMPGVLQIEALAQMAGIVLFSRKDISARLAFLLGVDRVKFRRTVVPGDQLILEVELKSVKSRVAEAVTRAYVDGSPATEAVIRFMLVE